jgi:hypothetical protein
VSHVDGDGPCVGHRSRRVTLVATEILHMSSVGDCGDKNIVNGYLEQMERNLSILRPSAVVAKRTESRTTIRIEVNSGGSDIVAEGAYQHTILR